MPGKVAARGDARCSSIPRQVMVRYLPLLETHVRAAVSHLTTEGPVN
jgi:hypothetical protein